jgi:aspartate kinase
MLIEFFSDAQKLEQLFHDAIELAYYGASVIHRKRLPLENKNIPLYVKSFVQPAAKGTMIGGPADKAPVPSSLKATSF